MCKSLKDIIAELETKYIGYELRYDFEERSRVIADFDRDMEYMFSQFERYEEDVKFVLDKKLDKNIILRSTINLALVLQHLCKSLDEYDYAIGAYLLDERYEKNHDLFSRFIDASNILLNRLDDLLKTDYFEVEPPNEREVFGKFFYDERNPEEHYVITASHFHKEVAEKLNGAEMIVCVKHLLKMFDDGLFYVKNSQINGSVDEMNKVYEINYLYYAKNYWPERERNFRPHIEHYYKIGIDELEKLRHEKMNDFLLTNTGKIWDKFSEDKYNMARQMKEQKFNEEQWKYFFENIFVIDDYTRWIEELREEAEYESATPPRAPQDNTTIDAREEIANELFDLAENGPWVNGITAEDIKKMLKNVIHFLLKDTVDVV